MTDTIAFLRHGDSYGNHDERFLGTDHLNFLTPIGCNQALNIALDPEVKFDKFYTSRMLRSYHTLMMALITYKHPWAIDQIFLRPEFNEWYTNLEPTYDIVVDRVKSAVKLLQQTEGNILVVSHNGFLSVMTRLMNIRIPDSALVKFENGAYIQHCSPFYVTREELNNVPA